MKIILVSINEECIDSTNLAGENGYFRISSGSFVKKAIKIYIKDRLLRSVTKHTP
jgi:hypothetical protein